MSFTGFMKLRTAGVIIGYVGVVLSLFAIVMLGMTIQTKVQQEEYATELGLRCSSPSFDTLQCVDMKILQIVMCCVILSAINYALIIVGCASENHWYLLPFLLTKGFILFLSLSHSVFYVATLDENTLRSWKIETFKISVAVFMAFIWCLIFALYRRFRMNRINLKNHNLKNVSLVPQDTNIPYKLQTV